VLADGGFKELPSLVDGVVSKADAINAGAPFKKGDVLVQLDTTDLDRQVQEAKENYASAQERLKLQRDANIKRVIAKETLDNAERLFKQDRASQDQVTQAQRALAAVDEELKLADFDVKKAENDFKNAMEGQARIKEKMSIKAPFDGAVEAPFAWEGQLIKVGTTVATIYSNARIVVAKISEEDISKVQLGQTALVTLLSYPGQKFDAKVIKILPTAEADTQRYSVWLDVKIDPTRLIPNSTGDVSITVGVHEKQPLIWRRAIFLSDQVFVVKNGRVERRKVKLGYTALNLTEVVEGLKPGELVITDDLDRYRDGQRVVIPEKQK